MSLTLPEPIEVPWTLKPIDSARTELRSLEDGRLHLSIQHDVLRGVTPEMLVHWFAHLEGDMDVAGKRYPRYRVWHPRDHVALTYVRRAPDGSIGPGARFRIQEVLGRVPEFEVNALTDITRLDLGGFAHRPRILGLPFARMDYSFSRVTGGTAYENSLTVGLEGAPTWLNRRFRDQFFPDAKGRAWLLHNVEEVGALEEFLPELVENDTAASG
jgi:hypothetical protein